MSSQVESPVTATPKQKGQLKVYLGYAAGVGKTYQMLVDAQQLKSHGTDVVIGYLESHGREDIVAQAHDLEVVPRRQIQFRGATFEEMDLDAILRRRPEVCLVDEIAHTNTPGSLRGKRWEDVQALTEEGIGVLTTMNVEHLESLNDQIWQITGIRVRDTIPDWVVKEADEIVLVDLSPRALLHRLERGIVVPPDQVQHASQTFFSEPALVALRELALREAAHEVGVRSATPVPARAPDRILVNVTSDPSTAMLLRRSRRVADYLRADCVAICVHSEKSLAYMPPAKRRAIERHLQFARSLHIDTCVVRDRNPARALVDWARGNRITQIFVSRKSNGTRRLFSGLDFVDQIVQHAGDLQVTVVAEHRRDGKTPVPYAEDIAAGFVNPRFARISPDMSVDEAIGELRRQAENVEMLYYAYVLDDAQRLAGVVSLRDLFSGDRNRKVRDIMKRDCVTVYEDTDCEVIAQLFTRHHLLAIPVIDRERRMIGIITTGDLVGLIQEEASEDIQKLGGMEALGAPYLEVGFLQMIRKRAGWLAILFVGEMLTATAMGYFEDEIARAVVLAMFLPLIISSGGNSGSQATTLVIRAMAMAELTLRDWWRVVQRELATGVALGVLLGSIGVLRIFLWGAVRGLYGPHYPLIALAIGCSLVGVVTFGTLAGSMLPFILRRFGLDPASASAPFVATLVDVTGLIIYFTVAMFVLRGSLL